MKQFSIFGCVDLGALRITPGLTRLPGVHADVKAGADKLGKLFSTINLFATHIVIHNIVIFTNLTANLSDGF